MAKFKNVTDQDLEVSIDGRLVFVAKAGEERDTFEVADQFLSTLASQPAFEAADEDTASAVAEHLASFEAPAVEEPAPPVPDKTDKKASAPKPEGDK